MAYSRKFRGYDPFNDGGAPAPAAPPAFPTADLLENFDPAVVPLGRMTSIVSSSGSGSTLDTSSVVPWAAGSPADKRPIATAGQINGRQAANFELQGVLRGEIIEMKHSRAYTMYTVIQLDPAYDENNLMSCWSLHDGDHYGGVSLYMNWLTDLAGNYVIVDGHYPRAFQYYISNADQTNAVYLWGGLAGGVDLTVPHILTLTCDGANGYTMHVDNVLDSLRVQGDGYPFPGSPMPAPITCPYTTDFFDWGTVTYESGGFRWGFHIPPGFDFPLTRAYGNWLCYDVAHDATQRAAVCTVASALWGTPAP